MKFSVIETGGKQYKVSAGQKLKIEKINAKVGDKIGLDRVLLIADNADIKIGTPLIDGASVRAEVIRQLKDDKKIVFRYHSKTRYRKKKGHRQSYTEIEII